MSVFVAFRLRFILFVTNNPLKVPTNRYNWPQHHTAPHAFARHQHHTTSSTIHFMLFHVLLQLSKCYRRSSLSQQESSHVRYVLILYRPSHSLTPSPEFLSSTLQSRLFDSRNFIAFKDVSTFWTKHLLQLLKICTAKDARSSHCEHSAIIAAPLSRITPL